MPEEEIVIDKDKFEEALKDEDDLKREADNKGGKKGLINQEAKEKRESIFDKITKDAKEDKQLFYCLSCKKTFEKEKQIYQKYIDFTSGKIPEMITINCPFCNSTRWKITRYIQENIKSIIKDKLNIKKDVNSYLLGLLWIWDKIETILVEALTVPIRLWFYFEEQLKVVVITGIRRSLSLLIILCTTNFLYKHFNLNVFGINNIGFIIAFLIVIITIIVIKWRS